MNQADDPAATVERYINAFNEGDPAGLAACFAVPGHILDGMAPHVWSGPSATEDWRRDVLAEAEHLDLNDFRVALDTPLHNAITGDAAYFVAPATMTFKARERKIVQTGATFTVALRKIDGRWLIAAWAWTKGKGGGTGDAS